MVLHELYQFHFIVLALDIEYMLILVRPLISHLKKLSKHLSNSVSACGKVCQYFKISWFPDPLFRSVEELDQLGFKIQIKTHLLLPGEAMLWLVGSPQLLAKIGFRLDEHNINISLDHKLLIWSSGQLLNWSNG